MPRSTAAMRAERTVEQRLILSAPLSLYGLLDARDVRRRSAFHHELDHRGERLQDALREDLDPHRQASRAGGLGNHRPNDTERQSRSDAPSPPRRRAGILNDLHRYLPEPAPRPGEPTPPCR